MSRLTTLPTKVFFKSLNITEKQLKEINKEWEITYSKYKIDCFKGIKEAVKELYENNYILAIITSRTMSEFEELNKILEEVKNCFQLIVTSDLVENPKPSKDSMDYLIKEINCTEKDIIYIGDSLIDEEFAKNSNCTFIPAVWENKELMGHKNACIKPEKLIERIRLEN